MFLGSWILLQCNCRNRWKWQKGTNFPLHSIFIKGNNLTEEAQNIKNMNQATRYKARTTKHWYMPCQQAMWTKQPLTWFWSVLAALRVCVVMEKRWRVYVFTTMLNKVHSSTLSCRTSGAIFRFIMIFEEFAISVTLTHRHLHKHRQWNGFVIVCMEGADCYNWWNYPDRQNCK